MASETGGDHPAPRTRLRAALKLAGILVTVAATVFVAVAVVRSLDQLSAHVASPAFLATIALGGVGYALLLALLAVAWHGLLVATDGPVLRFRQALAIYARTQVYKYLPSNVLHMVGRYAEARRAGASHRALGIAQAAEVALVAGAGGVVAAIFAMPLLQDQLQAYGLEPSLLAGTVVASAALVTMLGVILIRRIEMRRLAGRLLGRAVAAFALYVLFFLGSGGIACCLAVVLGSPATPEIVGITAAAWLVGFLVPGAPNGLGVRDAVLIAGLTAAGVPGATAIAVGHRLVTVLGDALLALAGFLARRQG